MRKKKDFFKLFNILNSIYLYITVSYCHIRVKIDNNGEIINTKGNSDICIYKV